MKRPDKAALALAACSVAAGVILMATGSPAPLKADNAPAVEPGTPAFLELFEPEVTAELSKPRSAARGTPAQPEGGRSDDQPDFEALAGLKHARFGDQPLPDRLAGIEWRTAHPRDLAAAIAGGVRDPIELQQLVRALVARLRTSATDLELAIGLAKDRAGGRIAEIAIIALGRSGRASAEDALVDMATKGDAAMRNLAILSLAQCGQEPYLRADPADLRLVPYVMAATAQVITGRAAVVLPDLLARERDPSLVCLLVTLLDGAQDMPRYARSRNEVQEVDGRKVRELIVDLALKDSNDEVRKTAAQALASTRAPDAIQALAHIATTDASPGVRRYAALALSGCGEDERVFAAMKRAATSDPSATVRGEAARAIAPNMCGSRSEEAARLIAEIYRRDAAPDVRYECVAIFGTMGDGGRSMLAEAAAKDPDESIRQFARDLLQRR